MDNKSMDNKSNVSDEQLENELEKVKETLLKLNSEEQYEGETIEVPVEIVTLAKDILDSYLRYETDSFNSLGKHANIDEEIDEEQKSFISVIQTCVDVFNELLSK